jgi:5'-nucleotidase (lipoprotein e(P4) family)
MPPMRVLSASSACLPRRGPRRRVRLSHLSALSVALLGACATSTGPRTVSPPAVTTAPSPTAATVASARAPELPGAIAWLRRSAEYRALAHQAYTLAAVHLRDTVPTLGHAVWGVVLDADETVLDNSEYERRRALLDSAYSEASWAEWVDEAAAPAVPGAVAFSHAVHALGGRVVIVTNRAEALCGPTRANLDRLGVDPDLVLCQPPGEGDKNPRFRKVENGTASPDLPALTVVEWLGDNIQDFPGLTQAMRGDRAAYAPFGHAFFVIPNPMYGSWQKNEKP